MSIFLPILCEDNKTANISQTYPLTHTPQEKMLSVQRSNLKKQKKQSSHCYGTDSKSLIYCTASLVYSLLIISIVHQQLDGPMDIGKEIVNNDYCLLNVTIFIRNIPISSPCTNNSIIHFT